MKCSNRLCICGRPATDRKAIKDVIVEMTRAAASAKEAVAA